MKLGHKILLFLILFTIPFNFILLQGIGNVYLSTITLISCFVFLFIKTRGSIINKQNIILALILLFVIITTTFLNVFFNNVNDLKQQSVAVVIYIQNFIAFIIVYYLLNKEFYMFFLRTFLLITILSCLRVIVEESDKIFLFSTAWGERLEVNFIGAMNNFALICGLAFFISLFYIKNKFLKIGLCLFLFFMITASVSRGAFLGVLATLFVVGVYDIDKRTLKMLLKLSVFSILVGVIGLFYFDKSGVIVEKIQDRFLSVFSGEKDLSTFSSGRFDVWEDILIRFSESNIFEILFGYGAGSINFKVTFVHYFSSHNMFIDLLYKNGLIILLAYILILAFSLNLFLKNRSREKIGLFALFFFLHFEIMFNPFPFAAQTGWIYFAFLTLFIRQNQLTK